MNTYLRNLKRTAVFVHQGFFRSFHSTEIQRNLILGIETSCDDTGVAIMDTSGKILGEALFSQMTSKLGGVIPTFARDFHAKKIEKVTRDAVRAAGVGLDDVSAVAVTNRPGLAMSLAVGLKYAKYLCLLHGKPLIPIHHMEAHALTVRMFHEVQFPFLVCLVSGGHCLLGVARDLDDYLLLGYAVGKSPGELFDKVSRRLKLNTVVSLQGLSGGRAIEIMAKGGDPKRCKFPVPMLQYRNCMFSFSGLKSAVDRFVSLEEKCVMAHELVPSVNDICAGVQTSVFKSILQRTERAMIYCDICELIPDNRVLVLSGGVGSNQYFRDSLGRLCNEYDYELLVPPPKYCTDNGVMIAWNGVEKWLRKKDVLHDKTAIKRVDSTPKCPLGVDVSTDVTDKSIKVPLNSERKQYFTNKPHLSIEVQNRVVDEDTSCKNEL